MKLTAGSEAGQSVFELVIALAVAGTLIVGAVTAVSQSLQADVQGTSFQVGSFLSQELMTNVTIFADADWRKILDLAKSPAQYYLVVSGGAFATSTGSESVTIDAAQFTRSFTIANVSRDGNNDIEAVYNAANDDPSTQKVTVLTTWVTGSGTATSSLEKYLTRHGSGVFNQTDWAGGPTDPVVEILTSPNDKYATSTGVATTTGGFKIINL